MVLRLGLGNAVASMVLALVAAVAGVFARGRPALRHGLWLLVLLKLVTPPLWTVPVAWVGAAPGRARGGLPVAPLPVPDAGDAGSEAMQDREPILEEIAEPGAPAADVAAAARALSRPGHGWLLAVWGGGSLVTFGVAAVRIARFRRVLKLTEPAPASLRRQVEILAGHLGLAQVPAIGVVPGAVSPLVWALGGRPRLVVPRALWDRLDERQRTTLLAHELAHLKRRDHWVRGLELLATGFYWWLPVVWIARQGLREAEEQCCDAWVVSTFPGAARAYAEALLETLDFLAGIDPAAAVAASGLGPLHVHHLKRRMTMIMQGTTPRALTWKGLFAVLSLAAVLLPLAPTWAQQKPADDDGDEAASAPAATEPARRDRGPREKEQGDKSATKRERSDVRVSRFDRFDGEGSEQTIQALEKMLAELKELAARKPGGPLDERAREQVERAIDRLQSLLQKRRAEPGPRARGTPDAERPSARKPEGAKERAEAEQQRAEIARLRAEVAERHKAWMEAQRRLAEAMRHQGPAQTLPGPMARAERFEFHFGRPGAAPPYPEPPIRIGPRADQDKRIAELEERLEKLQDEVKSLKKDAPAK